MRQGYTKTHMYTQTHAGHSHTDTVNPYKQIQWESLCQGKYRGKRVFGHLVKFCIFFITTVSNLWLHSAVTAEPTSVKLKLFSKYKIIKEE